MKEELEFSDRYLVGVEQVDREHRRLFEICRNIHLALLGNSGSVANAAREAVRELADYTRTHFANEESLMASLAYPELVAHHRLHLDLLRQVSDMQMRVEIGDDSAALDVAHFLSRWLIDHIQGEDKRFGAFAAQAGKGA